MPHGLQVVLETAVAAQQTGRAIGKHRVAVDGRHGLLRRVHRLEGNGKPRPRRLARLGSAVGSAARPSGPSGLGARVGSPLPGLPLASAA